MKSIDLKYWPLTGESRLIVDGEKRENYPLAPGKNANGQELSAWAIECFKDLFEPSKSVLAMLTKNGGTIPEDACLENNSGKLKENTQEILQKEIDKIFALQNEYIRRVETFLEAVLKLEKALEYKLKQAFPLAEQAEDAIASLKGKYDDSKKSFLEAERTRFERNSLCIKFVGEASIPASENGIIVSIADNGNVLIYISSPSLDKAEISGIKATNFEDAYHQCLGRLDKQLKNIADGYEVMPSILKPYFVRIKESAEEQTEKATEQLSEKQPEASPAEPSGKPAMESPQKVYNPIEIDKLCDHAAQSLEEHRLQLKQRRDGDYKDLEAALQSNIENLFTALPRTEEIATLLAGGERSSAIVMKKSFGMARAEVISRFLQLTKQIDKVTDDVKGCIAEILAEHTQLGSIVPLKNANSATTWFEMLLEQFDAPECSRIHDALQSFKDFKIHTDLISIVDDAFSGADMSQTKGMASAEDVRFFLEMQMTNIQTKIRNSTRELSKAPNRELYAAVCDFQARLRCNNK